MHVVAIDLVQGAEALCIKAAAEGQPVCCIRGHEFGVAHRCEIVERPETGASLNGESCSRRGRSCERAEVVDEYGQL